MNQADSPQKPPGPSSHNYKEPTLVNNPNELEKDSMVQVRVPPQPTRISALGDLTTLHPPNQKENRCFLNKQTSKQTSKHTDSGGKQ